LIPPESRLPHDLPATPAWTNEAADICWKSEQPAGTFHDPSQPHGRIIKNPFHR